MLPSSVVLARPQSEPLKGWYSRGTLRWLPERCNFAPSWGSAVSWYLGLQPQHRCICQFSHSRKVYYFLIRNIHSPRFCIGIERLSTVTTSDCRNRVWTGLPFWPNRPSRGDNYWRFLPHPPTVWKRTVWYFPISVTISANGRTPPPSWASLSYWSDDSTPSIAAKSQKQYLSLQIGLKFSKIMPRLPPVYRQPSRRSSIVKKSFNKSSDYIEGDILLPFFYYSNRMRKLLS